MPLTPMGKQAWTSLTDANFYKKIIAVQANDKSTPTKQILAILGAILLFVGVFLPILSLPFAGGLNYFNNGTGDGTVVLLLAVISVFLAVTRRFLALWVTGLCSVGLLLFTLINISIRISEMHGQMETELAGNPFRGFAELAMSSVQLQWGWAVLMVGGVLTVAAAAMHSLENKSL